MITVLYTASNGYLPYMGISLISLLYNNPGEDVRVYAALETPSTQNLEKLQEIQRQYPNCTIKVVDAAPYIEQMKTLRMIQYRKSFVPNLRLFFGQYIDEDVERLLYLDCDTIITAPIGHLFTMDMDGICAGVSLDSLAGHYKKCLGYREEEPYFNAGILLINVREWNKNNCTKQLLEMIADKQYTHANLDQDWMNQLLHDKIMVLPPQYNLQPHHMCFDTDVYFFCFSRKGYYSPEEIREAVAHPVIIHAYRFLGNFTWHENNVHPALSYYKRYKELSPWKDIPDEEGRKGMAFALEKLAYLKLPHKMYFKVWCWMQEKYFVYLDKRIRKTANEIL